MHIFLFMHQKTKQFVDNKAKIMMFYNIENIFSNSNNMYSKKFNRKGKHITLNYSWILFILLRKERNNAIAFLKWKNFWWHRETLLELVDWFQLSRDCLMVAAVEQKLKSFSNTVILNGKENTIKLWRDLDGFESFEHYKKR